jgi:hypothetical protein
VKKLPIAVKNDTTSFSVSSFSDGSEQLLEDLIKKLPGLKLIPLLVSLSVYLLLQ